MSLGVKIELEGFDAVQKALKDLAPREANQVLKRTVTKIAADMRDEARRRVPVRDGVLKKAIRSRGERGTRTSREAGLRIHPKGFYWHFLEFGTRTNSAQPFIVPTVEHTRKNIAEIFRKHFFKQFARQMEKRANKVAGVPK